MWRLTPGRQENQLVLRYPSGPRVLDINDLKGQGVSLINPDLVRAIAYCPRSVSGRTQEISPMELNSPLIPVFRGSN